MKSFEDLLAELKTAREMVEGVDPNSVQADDLAILELQIQRKLAVAGFEPLSGIPSVGLPDFTQLREASVALKKAIADEERRTAIVGRILGAAKNIARVSGIPIP